LYDFNPPGIKLPVGFDLPSGKSESILVRKGVVVVVAVFFKMLEVFGI
jgi:hypothetical protein